jgi:riboflavin kinase/FMN adenylyltransferase
MTFEPHPVAILHPERAPGVLTPLEVKAHFLQEAGADFLIVLRDTASLLSLTAEDFVDKFLVGDVRPVAVVEGEDFNFGAERIGTVEKLAEMGKSKGFEVVVVEPMEVQLSTGQTVKVSSTLIRYMLESGHVADAARLLGHHYLLVGMVIPGRGKGKELGYPTLNMREPGQVLPAEGVYAGYVRLGGDRAETIGAEQHMPAVFSIGQARTFGDEFPLLVEAHLLQDGEPSGQWMGMEFVERIRKQRKFNSAEELAAQIARDCKRAREILAGGKSA